MAIMAYINALLHIHSDLAIVSECTLVPITLFRSRTKTLWLLARCLNAFAAIVRATMAVCRDQR